MGGPGSVGAFNWFLDGDNFAEGAFKRLARFIRFDLARLLNEAFGLFLVLGFDFGFRNHLRLMSRLISQSLALDTTDHQIGALLIVNTKGLTGIVPEIELGKVAI